jgi:hypothetical protein
LFFFEAPVIRQGKHSTSKMAFMQQTVLALACLAIVASAPLVAAQCKTTLQTQSATVNKQAPKGCVARSIESGDFVLPDASCLNELVLNVTNTTGVDCDEAATSVAVGFKNVTGCMEGKIGTANLTALKAGGYNIKGSFIVGTNFTGKQSADAKSMTVSVENINCELTYTLKALTKAVGEDEAEEATNSTAAPAEEATNSTAAPAAPETPAGPAPAEGSKKSSAAGLSGVAAVVAAVLGAAVAALAL